MKVKSFTQVIMTEGMSLAFTATPGAGHKTQRDLLEKKWWNMNYLFLEFRVNFKHFVPLEHFCLDRLYDLQVLHPKLKMLIKYCDRCILITMYVPVLGLLLQIVPSLLDKKDD